MLSLLLGHAARPLAPHDLWSAWNLHPLLLLGLAAAGWAYGRGRALTTRSFPDRWRARSFTLAGLGLGVALVSPLDAAAGALASAHMVQHLLVLLAAAPLLALSDPWATMLRGYPPGLRRLVRRSWRPLATTAPMGAVRHPIARWLLHAGTIWIWHASVLYGAALRHEPVHLLEHCSLLVTGVLFWAVILPERRARTVAPGHAVLLLFAMAMQNVFLAALLTFAGTPWYGEYATTTQPWGITPLADQQLAGVIMWVPAGAVYPLAALVLLARWVRQSERSSPAFGGPRRPEASTDRLSTPRRPR